MVLKKYMSIFFILILGISLLFCQKVLAYEAIDLEADNTLSLYFKPQDSAAEGVLFKIYKTADVSEDCKFTLCGAFSDYAVNLDGLDNDGWRAAAQTLNSYVSADAISPEKTAYTDVSGCAAFSGLKAGLYLVTGESFSRGGYTFTPTPFLVCLPSYKDGSWVYETSGNIKYESKYNSGGSGSGSDDNKKTIKVLKAWKNTDDEAIPTEISVTLYKDGEPFESVLLNADNNWRYIWENLEDNGEWTLLEDEVPQNYTVTVEKEGITFLVTNTYNKNIEKETSGGGSSHITGKDPEDNDGYSKEAIPNIPNLPDDEDADQAPIDNPADESIEREKAEPPAENKETLKNSGEKLPQTGVAWVRLTFLAALGIFMFLLGVVFQGKKGAVKSGKKQYPLIKAAGLLILGACVVFLALNIYYENRAEKAAEDALLLMKFDTPLNSEEVGEPVIPDYILNPDMDMLSEDIDGISYIGKIEIPSVNISLPVISDWSYKNLRTAPCRYFGSVYKNNMVIAGHNYKTHFSPLKSLLGGDEVVFTDIDGNVFDYCVSETEVLSPQEVSEMTSGEWDLTLFTCTPTGSSRLAVRCELKQ